MDMDVTMIRNKILVCALFLGLALSVFADIGQGIINEAEQLFNEGKLLMHIVPSSGQPNRKNSNNILYKKSQLADFVGKDNEYYNQFIELEAKGYAMKWLTFNIYDDNTRNTTISLFRMLQNLELEDFMNVKQWAMAYINHDMFHYVERLVMLYGSHGYHLGWNANYPPFLDKPNFYANGETIVKALKLKSNDGNYDYSELKVSQIFRVDDIIAINTNYSNWNYPVKGCEERLDYLIEDIGLNSYYYGLHLLHPFWMPNSELDEANPRHAEHYYFNHKQLFTRYKLEKYSMTMRGLPWNETCENIDYVPYLIYENGLPFPTRNLIMPDQNEAVIKLKKLNIAIKELLDRQFIIEENDTKVNLTEENYVNLIARLLRDKYDSIEMAKIIRSFYGYGQNGYPCDRYNPNPSVLHQPQTTLRDPVYWYLIQHIVSYFKEFEKSLEPFDMSQHESDDIIIMDASFTKLVTYFKNYQFVINRSNNKLRPFEYTARQRRLQHSPIVFNFTVTSKQKTDAVVRLFLGRQCEVEECWENYDRYFQLDAFKYTLEQGKNLISWNPNNSLMISTDTFYNKEIIWPQTNNNDEYNMFRFPNNLLFPKSSEDGLNFILFVIITYSDDNKIQRSTDHIKYYKSISYELDTKPLGFPFHRKSINHNLDANNYKFYNITIFHEKTETSGYFSPHLF